MLLGVAAVYFTMLLRCIYMSDRNLFLTGSDNVVRGEWSIYIGNEYYGENALPQKYNVPAGEMMTITKTVNPSDFNGYTVCFYSGYQNVYIYLDNELQYEKTQDDAIIRFKVAQPGWVSVKLPSECAGKLLAVQFTTPYSFSSGRLPEIYSGDSAELLSLIAAETILPLTLCTAVFTISVLMIIIIAVTGERGKPNLMLYNLTLFLGFCSLFLIVQTYVPMITFLDDASRSFIASLSMMCAPIPFMTFIRERYSKKVSAAFNAFAQLFVINAEIQVLLHLMRVTDLSQMRYVTYGLIFIGISAVFALMKYRKVSGHRIIDVIEVAGFATFALSLTAQVVLTVMKSASSSVIVTVGLFIYVVCLTSSSYASAYLKLAEKRRLEKALSENKTRLLMNQIRPHFLYNALGAIRMTIKTDPEKAYDLTYDLTKFMRANIDAYTASELIPFSSELELIKAYVRIEKARFGNKLNVQYDIDTDSFFALPLSVQPIIENAIKHGIYSRDSGGTVRLSVLKENGCVVVKITDDGVGFDPEVVDGKEGSVGLSNVRYRFEQILGAKMLIESAPDAGTRVSVTIPSDDE